MCIIIKLKQIISYKKKKVEPVKSQMLCLYLSLFCFVTFKTLKFVDNWKITCLKIHLWLEYNCIHCIQHFGNNFIK